MIQQHLRALALAVAAAMLCACGGGGSAMPAASGTTATAGSGSKVSANLSLVFPASFHHVKTLTSVRAAAAKVRAASSSRVPKYVNPSGGNTIQIYVDTTQVVNANVSNTTTGTQNFTIPLLSSDPGGNDIVAVEYDSAGDILAIGEDFFGNSFSPATAPNVTLTMFMNVMDLAIADTGDDSDNSAETATQLDFSPYYIGSYNAGPPPLNQAEFWLFAVDATGGFVTNPGVGGVNLPAGQGQSNIIVTQLGFNEASYDANGDQISFQPYVVNTAISIASGPGAQALSAANLLDLSLIGTTNNLLLQNTSVGSSTGGDYTVVFNICPYNSPNSGQCPNSSPP